MAINFPSNPSNGDTHAGFTYSSSVGAWRATAGVSTTLSNTAPSSPSDGDLWWNTNTSKLYISYDDGSSTQWVQAAVPGATGPAGASGSSVTSYANTSAFPSSGNSVGDFAFATNTKAVYIWDGLEWDRISAGVDESPVIITEPPTTSNLNQDGSTSTVTMVAQDPEGFDITYGIAYKTSGNALPSQLVAATTVNANGVYTLTPSANNSHAGSFRARLSASDGARTTTRFVDFTLSFDVVIELLLIAGGGGGNDSGGGGGGAGGLVLNTSYTALGATTYNITVGTGGIASQAQGDRGGAGANSTFSQGSTLVYTATGGGGGGPYPQTGSGDGGSGAGAGRATGSTDNGSSTQASYSGLGFGNAGGISTSSAGAGSGGGAGGAGNNGGYFAGGAAGSGADGGAGKAVSITGSSVFYAPGGPGAGYDVAVGNYVNGSASSYGAGGAGGLYGVADAALDGANGVCIIAAPQAASAVTGTYTLDTSGRSGYYVYTFTGSGSITF